MTEESLPSLAVIMPAYNAAAHLPKSLGRLVEIGGWDELIVVNPGSSDETSALASEMGARVIDLGHRGGPAEARNAGVDVVQSEIVLFVDSDCVVAEDALDRVRQAFTDPKLVTITGSYDDHPPEQNLASLYMNLRHHFTHQ
ncbi:MAG: glycosyltransferase involved in cell wall biosynthesis, partial [Planctomycetota bacterium]